MSKILGKSAFTPLMDWMPSRSTALSFERPNSQATSKESRILPSRRKVLVAMATIPPAMAVAGCWPTQALAASAPSAFWTLGRADFVLLLTWFINKALKNTLSSAFSIGEKDVNQVSEPKPGGTSFHDQFASIFTVNPRIVIKNTRTDYGFYLALREFLRAHKEAQIPAVKDVNGTELRRCRHVNSENDGKYLIFPCGPRTPPDDQELTAFGNYCRQTGMKRSDFKLEYCRPFSDGESMYRGFAIRSEKLGPSGTDLLISDDD